MTASESGQVTGRFSPFLERRRNRMVATYIPDGSRVLDIGCGRAALLEVLHAGGKKDIAYTGVDLLPAVIADNARRFPEQRFHHLDIEKDGVASLPGGQTVITLIAIVEHLHDPRELVRSLTGLLVPGGRMIFTAPARGAEWVHRLGARLGLFSRAAAEEHNEIFPDHALFRELAAATGLDLRHYRRFLLGFNQVAVLERPRAGRGDA